MTDTAYDIGESLGQLIEATNRIEINSRRRSGIARRLLPEVEQEMQQYEAAYVAQVATQLDDKGKPAFTNAETRRAAVETGLQLDQGYQQKRERRIALQIELDQLDAAIEADRRHATRARLQAEWNVAALRVMGA